jgi:hypothetical protein
MPLSGYFWPHQHFSEECGMIKKMTPEIVMSWLAGVKGKPSSILERIVLTLRGLV